MCNKIGVYGGTKWIWYYSNHKVMSIYSDKKKYEKIVSLELPKLRSDVGQLTHVFWKITSNKSSFVGSR